MRKVLGFVIVTIFMMCLSGSVSAQQYRQVRANCYDPARDLHYDCYITTPVGSRVNYDNHNSSQSRQQERIPSCDTRYYNCEPLPAVINNDNLRINRNNDDNYLDKRSDNHFDQRRGNTRQTGQRTSIVRKEVRIDSGNGYRRPSVSYRVWSETRTVVRIVSP